MAQLIRILLIELLAPRADGFIGYENATHEQELLDAARSKVT